MDKAKILAKKMRYKTGLIVGRFQPFHLGHLSMIRQGLEVCEKVKIVIGSSNRNFEQENPLTAEERLKILNLVISKEKWEGKILEVKFLKDVVDNLEWMESLVKISGKFEVVIGNDSLVSVLAKYKGYEIFRPKLSKREIWQATIIRQNIMEDKKWKSLVPEYELKLLEKFRLEERLRELAESDKIS